LSFAGLSNIIRLTQDPVFQLALTNTILFFIIQVPIMLTLALVIAVLLDDPRLVCRGLLRTMIFLPCVMSLVVYAVLFKRMFVLDGVVNRTLIATGLVDGPIPWMSDPFWARVLLILAITWRWTGYNMIFYLAALQNIDKSIYEVSRIDGVPAWARFFRITVPMLKPVILFTTVTSTIGTLQLFDEARNIVASDTSAGTAGPGDSVLTLSVYIYNLTFRFMPNFGYAATVSYVIVVVVALLAFLQFYVARERDR
jgi:lactose/L-arabinose transport system permease protein